MVVSHLAREAWSQEKRKQSQRTLWSISNYHYQRLWQFDWRSPADRETGGQKRRWLAFGLFRFSSSEVIRAEGSTALEAGGQAKL